MIYKKGICSSCGKEKYITKPSKKLCQGCNSGRLKNKTAKPKQSQVEMFKEISQEKPEICFVCGKRIPQLTVSNFAHIIPKGKYPRFKFRKDNIAILCHDFMTGDSCHHTWDFKPRSEIKNDPKWAGMFRLEEELKEEYSKLNQNEAWQTLLGI